MICPLAFSSRFCDWRMQQPILAASQSHYHPSIIALFPALVLLVVVLRYRSSAGSRDISKFRSYDRKSFDFRERLGEDV